MSTQLKYYGVFFFPITVFRNILFVKILGQISLEIESDDYNGDIYFRFDIHCYVKWTYLHCKNKKNKIVSPSSLQQGPSWSLSYVSWIYNYLCNQCLTPLTEILLKVALNTLTISGLFSIHII
jgi:hypothetical protein